MNGPVPRLQLDQMHKELSDFWQDNVIHLRIKIGSGITLLAALQATLVSRQISNISRRLMVGMANELIRVMGITPLCREIFNEGFDPAKGFVELTDHDILSG